MAASDSCSFCYCQYSQTTRFKLTISLQDLLKFYPQTSHQLSQIFLLLPVDLHELQVPTSPVMIPPNWIFDHHHQSSRSILFISCSAWRRHALFESGVTPSSGLCCQVTSLEGDEDMNIWQSDINEIPERIKSHFTYTLVLVLTLLTRFSYSATQ